MHATTEATTASAPHNMSSLGQPYVLNEQEALQLIDQNGHARIPDHVTAIGVRAFVRAALRSVDLGSRITSIDVGAFTL